MTPTHHVRPQWPDTIVYEDEEGRTITFDTRSMTEPPHVVVPTVVQWPGQVPAWAQAQRESIVQRLRAAGCIIVERDGNGVRTLSPDGLLRVDEDHLEDERAGPWETIQLIDVASGKSLAFALNHDASEVSRFPRPGIAVLSMQDRAGLRHHVEIDTVAGTFRVLGVDANGAGEEPTRLSGLEKRLGLGPSAPYVPEPVQNAMYVGLQLVLALASLIFVLGGVWMLLTAAAPKDRWTGLAGVLFFGACGVVSLLEIRSYLRQRPAKPKLKA